MLQKKHNLFTFATKLFKKTITKSEALRSKQWPKNNNDKKKKSKINK